MLAISCPSCRIIPSFFKKIIRYPAELLVDYDLCTQIFSLGLSTDLVTYLSRLNCQTRSRKIIDIVNIFYG